MFEIVSLERKGLTPEPHISMVTDELCNLWESEYPFLQNEIGPSHGHGEKLRAYRCGPALSRCRVTPASYVSLRGHVLLSAQYPHVISHFEHSYYVPRKSKEACSIPKSDFKVCSS